MAGVFVRILPEADRGPSRAETTVTVSTDTAAADDVERSPQGWGAFNVLLAVAVLILICGEGDLPYGLEAVQPWLRHALVPIGALLVASLLRRAFRNTRTFGIRIRRRLRDIIGVEVFVKKKTKSSDR
jgi:hypothetical protein